MSHKRKQLYLVIGAIGLFFLFRKAGGTEPPIPPPPPPPDNPQTPPFGLVLQEFGYTGSVSISRIQYSETFPRYEVRVRQLTGSPLSLACFVMQPGGKLETFRVYSNVPSGTIKAFSFSANLTIPEQVGGWIAFLYASPDLTMSSSSYVGKAADFIGEDVQEIP